MSAKKRLADLERKTAARRKTFDGECFTAALDRGLVLVRGGDLVPLDKWPAGLPAATRQALEWVLMDEK